METHEKLVNDNYRFTIESVIYGSYVKTGRLDDMMGRPCDMASINTNGIPSQRELSTQTCASE